MAVALERPSADDVEISDEHGQIHPYQRGQLQVQLRQMRGYHRTLENRQAQAATMSNKEKS